MVEHETVDLVVACSSHARRNFWFHLQQLKFINDVRERKKKFAQVDQTILRAVDKGFEHVKKYYDKMLMIFTSSQHWSIQDIKISGLSSNWVKNQ